MRHQVPNSVLNKSYAFALAALLSTLLFAFGAQAQSNCRYGQSGGMYTATCAATNDSGYVYHYHNGWQAVASYSYNYSQKLWILTDRAGVAYVLTTKGWVAANEYNALAALNALAQSSNAPAAQNLGGGVVKDANGVLHITPKSVYEDGTIDTYYNEIQALNQAYSSETGRRGLPGNDPLLRDFRYPRR